MASATSAAVQYRIIRIPTTSPRLTDLVAKFRNAKLAALQAEPGGFAVKHADEILHPIELWQKRIVPPSTILICVTKSDPEMSEEDVLLREDWIGMATLRGPLEHEVYYVPEIGLPTPDNANKETRWHLCNLYTSAAHRGKGLAKKLVNASINSAIEQTRALEGRDKARIRLFCNPEKKFLVEMYERMGFTDAGKCTLKEAFVANGDESIIPEDTRSSEGLRQIWERRYGLAMEKVVGVV